MANKKVTKGIKRGVVKGYKPSQSAPDNDQALRYYLNRELRNIGAAISDLTVFIQDPDNDCCLPLCDTGTEGHCTEWILPEYTTDFAPVTNIYTATNTTARAYAQSQCRRLNLLSVWNDEIHLCILDFVATGNAPFTIYRSPDLGNNWFELPFYPDIFWSTNEQDINSQYDQYPNDRVAWLYGEPQEFTVNSMRRNPSNGDVHCVLSTTANGDRPAYIVNLRNGTVVQTGWSTGCSYRYNDTASTIYAETYKEFGDITSRRLYEICWWNGALTSEAELQDPDSPDPYPERHTLRRGNSVCIWGDGQGYALRMEQINDHVIGYGYWGLAGGGGVDYRWMEFRDTITFGIPYKNEYEWDPTLNNGLGRWKRVGPEYTLQDEGRVRILTSGPEYIPAPELCWHRPATWFPKGSQYMLTANERYATKWSTIDDGVLWDLYPERVQLAPTSQGISAQALNELGAVVSVEFLTFGDYTNLYIKISPTGEPGTYTQEARFRIPSPDGFNTNTRAWQIEFSKTQNKFVLGYLDQTSRIRVVTFDNPFVCAVRAPGTGFDPQDGDILRYEAAEEAWCNFPFEHPLYSTDHTDVDTTNTPEVGAALVYDGAAWGSYKAFVASAYGGIRKTTSTAFNPGATWTTIPEWTSAIVAVPSGITQDFANSGLVIVHEGVYNANVILTMTIDNANAGRSLQVRMYNVTQASGGTPLNIYVARNQDGFTMNITFMADFAAVGDLIVIQLRSDDVFTSSSVDNAEFSVSSISEFRGAV